MRAATYTRVSTRDKGQDTANQLDQLRDLCRARSWEVAAEYEDGGAAQCDPRDRLTQMIATVLTDGLAPAIHSRRLWSERDADNY